MLQKPNKYRIIFMALAALLCVGMILGIEYQSQALALIKNSIETLQVWREDSPLLFIAGYAASYMFFLLIFIPVDTVFMLLAGAVFSLPVAVLLACTVHTTGSLSTFYISRYLWRHEREEAHKPDPTVPPQGKNGQKSVVNAWFTLLLLRMAPLIPTHAISMVMAGSPLSARGFYTATWLGSLPLTFCMAYIGREITHIDNLDAIMTPEVMIGLVALIIGLLVGKAIYTRHIKV